MAGFERSLQSRESSGKAPPSAQDGLMIEQVFSSPGHHPFDQLKWEMRTARIGDDKGGVVFEQKDVEVPADWSQLATNVVASKYFYGEQGKPEREGSVRKLVHRVTRTITDWAKNDGLFASDADAERFYNELTYLCINQYGSFNSPVWFNVGLLHEYGVAGSEGNYHWDAGANQPARTMKSYEYPQASACFIQSVDDTMEDIMRLATAEAMLFKYGSGTGSDLSTLRSSREMLSGGGKPSGPLSFMRIFDQIAAVVRSGGKTRRAAKMQSLRVDHPDIREFIECKMIEEKKAQSLIAAGYDGGMSGEAYSSVMYQNANLSVRVTEEFMQAAAEDRQWETRAVTTGKPLGKHKAKDLLELIAEGTRVCGDPGVQYHTTINRWHTCPQSGPINASNPCSEYMFVDDSACNLASLNLLKFRRKDGSFDTDRFRHAVRLFIIAQEVLVDHASYPNERICRNSHDFRPLGLGYANLGSLLMSLGLPYDSDGGRAVAAGVTAVMTAAAYSASAELASRVGPFAQFRKNRADMIHVIRMHREAVGGISAERCPQALLAAAQEGWEEALAAGERYGFRNAQVTVLAPTGTIGFMMDCDTTGIEPDIGLVKYKQLAGGGGFKIVNRTVPLALERLGYDKARVAELEEHISKNDTIEGAAALKPEHIAVFDCALRPPKGQRTIHYMGHIRMMAAVQPFLSGAISKTVNMPAESTMRDILQVYVDGWKLGLKAVAIYRDGSKRAQPVDLKKKQDKEKKAHAGKYEPQRRRMPATAKSVRHKFDIAGHEGYLHVGVFDDNAPGELFITVAKEGSTVGGMMDAFATAISLCLQYGVPLEALVKKFSHQRFEPSGITQNRDIPFAKSIVDYIFRWMGMEFIEEYRKAHQASRDLPTGTGAASPTSNAPAGIMDGSVSGAPDRSASDRDAHRPPGGMLHPPVLDAALQRNKAPVDVLSPTRWAPGVGDDDAPACGVCGAIMIRNGACHKCPNCGSTEGCS